MGKMKESGEDIIRRYQRDVCKITIEDFVRDEDFYDKFKSILNDEFNIEGGVYFSNIDHPNYIIIDNNNIFDVMKGESLKQFTNILNESLESNYKIKIIDSAYNYSSYNEYDYSCDLVENGINVYCKSELVADLITAGEMITFFDYSEDAIINTAAVKDILSKRSQNRNYSEGLYEVKVSDSTDYGENSYSNTYYFDNDKDALIFYVAASKDNYRTSNGYHSVSYPELVETGNAKENIELLNDPEAGTYVEYSDCVEFEEFLEKVGTHFSNYETIMLLYEDQQHGSKYKDYIYKNDEYHNEGRGTDVHLNEVIHNAIRCDIDITSLLDQGYYSDKINTIMFDKIDSMFLEKYTEIINKPEEERTDNETIFIYTENERALNSYHHNHIDASLDAYNAILEDERNDIERNNEETKEHEEYDYDDDYDIDLDD